MEFVLALLEVFSPIFWPLAFLLLGLLILRQVRADVRPIFLGMTASLKLQSYKYATLWAMAMMYAAAASLQAMAEVATSLGWVYIAAAAKVMQPGIVAIIAYVNKGPALPATLPEHQPEKP